MKLKKLHPFGIQITSDNSQKSLLSVSGKAIHAFMTKHKFILFKNFSIPTKTALAQFSKNLGPLLSWEFGHIMEMKPNPFTKNYLFTQGAVPFHLDGAFYQAPHYLIFHCVAAPETGCGGETIFCNTEMLYRDATATEKMHWKKLSLTYRTEKLAHYGGNVSVPLIYQHPVTRKKTIRFAEPVSKEMLNPVSVHVNELDEPQSNYFIGEFSKKCYQDAYCYTHLWQENDILIADNFSLLHARTAFTKASQRHLRRIQVL